MRQKHENMKACRKTSNNAQYLGNGAIYDKSYCYSLIGSHSFPLVPKLSI